MTKLRYNHFLFKLNPLVSKPIFQIHAWLRNELFVLMHTPWMLIGVVLQKSLSLFRLAFLFFIRPYMGSMRSVRALRKMLSLISVITTTVWTYFHNHTISLLVGREGLEPSRFWQRILRPSRLPVPTPTDASHLNLVGKGGLEPPRPYGHQPLKLMRLPVPPPTEVKK